MGAYILRRLLLIIPTLLGIMLINFALVQFVPGGPVEQAIARIQGGGDVFEGFSGDRMRGMPQIPAATRITLAHGACRPNSSQSLRKSSALTNRR